MIELRNVKKKYGKRVLFSDVNLKIDKCGLYCFKGENGTGKTTLLNIISRCIKPSRGKIISRFKCCSFVSQKVNLINTMTIREIFKMLRIDCNLLKKIYLFSQLDKYPDELSLGMQQRIAILIGLYSSSSLVILDEPISHLDNKRAELLMKEIKRVSKKKIVLIVNHNQPLNDKYCDCIYEIKNKKVLQIYGENKNKNKVSCSNNIKIKNKLYFKTLLKRNKLINLFFFLIFFFLLFVSIFIINIRENFSLYFDESKDGSIDYNKFYLKQCERINNGKLVIKQCKNLQKEQILSLEKAGYKVSINYDVFLNDLYNSEIISVINPYNLSLHHGRYPEKYNEVVVSDGYSLGDKIIIETTKIINYDKVDIYKNQLILTVVGISKKKPFISDKNLYLDYSLIDDYLKKEYLINNDITLYEYFNNMDVSDYKYILYFNEIDLSVLQRNNIEYLSSSYEYYQTLENGFNEIMICMNYLIVIIFVFFFIHSFKLIRKKIRYKVNDILFFKSCGISKKKVVNLLNKDNAFFIKSAGILGLMFSGLANYLLFGYTNTEIGNCCLLIVCCLLLNKKIVKIEVRRKLAI